MSNGHPLAAIADYTLAQIRLLHRAAIKSRLITRQTALVDATLAARGDPKALEEAIDGVATLITSLEKDDE